jgi:hypothetical protein
MSLADDLRQMVAQELFEALQAIRHGRGWDVDDIRLGVVPEPVRRRLGIDTSGPEAEQLQHLAQLIRAALAQLSEADQAWIRWAYNLEDHEDLEWTDRLNDMAEAEGLGARTIQRGRVDPALERLRDRLLSNAEGSRRRAAASPQSDPPARRELQQLLQLRANFRTLHLDASLYLYRDRVEVRETRELQAQRDGVQDLVISRVLFKDETTVETVVTEAGQLVGEPYWPTDKWFLCVVRFPEPLAEGERRRCVVTHTARNMAPLCVSSARKGIDHLTIRLQCMDVRPATLWRIERLPEAVLQAHDLLPTVDRHAIRVELDRYGYYEADFELVDELLEGLAWDLDGVVPRPETEERADPK